MDFPDVPTEAIDQNPLTTWHLQRAEEYTDEFFNAQFKRMDPTDRKELISLQVKFQQELGFTCDPHQLWEQYLNFCAHYTVVAPIVRRANDTDGIIIDKFGDLHKCDFLEGEGMYSIKAINSRDPLSYSSKYKAEAMGGKLEYLFVGHQGEFVLDTKEGVRIKVVYEQHYAGGRLVETVSIAE